MTLYYPAVRKTGRYEFELLENFELDGISVPAGFKMDGASVPRVLWWAFNPAGELFEASIIHDYQYRFKINSKDDADKRFHRCAKYYGAKRSILAYWAVKIGGKWK